MTAAPKYHRNYYCAFTDWQCGMEKHRWARIWFGVAHILGMHGLYMMFITRQIPLSVLTFVIAHGCFAGIGITLGAHRYWSHKTFKAKLPLQLLLAYMQTAAAQGPIFKWCRDHRIHHKYVDTESDPHNSNKGFWFSHIGWLLQSEHPSFTEKKDVLDFSDLDQDPIIRFQAKYYWILLVPISVYIVPMTIQHYFWSELNLYELLCANYIWYMIACNFTFLVNSAAHIWGYRPYDKNNRSRENKLVAILALGEGWHNYHHTFPWDYKAAEVGFYRYNLSTMVLDFFAFIGWAYDLKTVPDKLVRDRVRRTGDGSHILHGESQSRSENNNGDKGQNDAQATLPAWGWGDKDIPKSFLKLTETLK